jgi:hypothetical protein
MRDRGAGGGLAVLQVVQQAEDRLQEEEADDDGAEDGVCRIIQLRFVRNRVSSISL